MLKIQQLEDGTFRIEVETRQGDSTFQWKGIFQRVATESESQPMKGGEQLTAKFAGEE